MLLGPLKIEYDIYEASETAGRSIQTYRFSESAGPTNLARHDLGAVYPHRYLMYASPDVNYHVQGVEKNEIFTHFSYRPHHQHQAVHPS